MLPARKPRLKPVIVRARVLVDPERCEEVYGIPADDLVEWTKRYCITLVNESAARQQGVIVSARRSGA